MLQALWRSPSLRAAAAMGVGGLCFSAGGLILARELPTQEYARVSLVLGIVSVAGNIAPLGLDQVVGRRGLRLNARWTRASFGASLASAVAVALLAGLVYHLPPALMASVAAITLALGVALSIGAHFQGQRRFGIGVWVLQLLNGTIALSAGLTAALGLDTAAEVCGLMALMGAAAAALAWWILRREHAAQRRQLSPWRARGEAFSLATMQAGSSMLMQLERLLIEPTVGLQDLATYGVLAAFVSSPFRLLQAAVQFTLIPRLREAHEASARRALMRREGVLVAIPLAAGSAAIWLLAPPLAHWLLAGRYDLSKALIAVVLVGGWMKLLNGFLTAVVVSRGEERRLRWLSAICWISLAASVAGAFAAIPWGLVGVLGGIAAGWLLRCLLVGRLAVACLRDSPATGLVMT
jgi:O-antigen/teichoic acid export membrane protein